MKTALKLLFTILFVVSALVHVNAQRTGGGFSWDRVVYGGGVFPSFSNWGTSFSANPFVGYKVTDRFTPGLMVQYQYVSYNSNAPWGASKFQIAGISPFARYIVYKGIFVQAEYEFLRGSIEQKPFPKTTFSENNLLIGGGYINQISNRSGVFIQAMYIPTRDPLTSVYPSDWVFRIGFTIF